MDLLDRVKVAAGAALRAATPLLVRRAPRSHVLGPVRPQAPNVPLYPALEPLEP